ncbi:MAG: hypothetical protein APF76_17655 [Desulfitibacter sp. BRH_c19]|nr:MAG: hypothetical protein APF76_17655 [Desulfitibacter sp. BRH_c19]
MKKFKIKSYIIKVKENISNLKKSIISRYKEFSPKKYPKVALLLVLLAATAVLGSTAYYTGIIDSFMKDQGPTIEVIQEEPEEKTIPSVIPEAPDVIGTPSLPKEEKKVPKDINVVDESPNLTFPADGEIIREFGFNYSKTYKDYRFHDGIDIEVPEGASVQAAAAGKAVTVSYTEIDGYTITIDHGSYLQTQYKHLCEVDIARGDTLEQGQVIGKINNPDSYLHFSISHKGDNQDPTTYLFYEQ